MLGSKGGTRHEAQSVIDRLGSLVGRLHEAFQPSGNEEVNTTPYVQRLTDEVIYQLSRLNAEAKLQRDDLATSSHADPARLEVAIYGLSGIREQLDLIVAKYEEAVARARKLDRQQTSGTGPLQRGTSSGGLDSSGIHQQHALTLVAYEQAKKDPGFWAKLLNRNPIARDNETIRREVIATYAEFIGETDSLQKEFHTAQARSLDQLAAPMDMLRGSSQALHSREVTFYH
jgi:hypothetical protein